MAEHLAMLPVPMRRVVTGHDEMGQATVLIDAPATNSRASGSSIVSTLLWSSDRTPADISTGRSVEDMGARVLGIQPPANGTRFVVNDIAPGATPMHRTDTIDYVIVLTGTIDLDLPDQTVSLRAGDVVVQRGTNHAWANRSSELARIVVVLIDAIAPEAQ